MKKLIIIFIFVFYNKKFEINKIYKREDNIDYTNSNFAILRRIDCPICGFFSYYIVYLGCINKYLLEGFIPIVDLQSFDNIFNGFNFTSSKNNPWEYFFKQPYGYTLNTVKVKAKNIYYFECKDDIIRPNVKILFNKVINDFWHNIAHIYVPLKLDILLEANKIIKQLFNNTNNILGILVRGTDYISLKPKDHPIQPSPRMVIRDIKEIDKKNKYEWFFISTEDDSIREIFINEFKQKLKFLKYNKKLNYSKKHFLGYNENIKGNMKFTKIYILNMIILSKCIDIICSQTSGAIGLFILRNKKFRNIKIYNLGLYK